MKRAGSLSASSSDNQAIELPHNCFPVRSSGLSGGQCLGPAIHSLTRVVLPKPAGAEMRVNLRPKERPSFKRSIRRGRRTIFGRGGGIYNFVAKIVVDIDPLYNSPQREGICLVIDSTPGGLSSPGIPHLQGVCPGRRFRHVYLLPWVVKKQIEQGLSVCYYYERKSGYKANTRTLLPQFAATKFFGSLNRTHSECRSLLIRRIVQFISQLGIQSILENVNRM